MERDQENAFVAAVAAGGPGRDVAFESLLHMHRGFIYKVSRYYARKRPQNDLDDYLQAAKLGLFRACQAFDPARGTTFLTYAAWKIKQEVQLLMRSSVIRCPTSDYSGHRLADETVRRLDIARRGFVQFDPDWHEFAYDDRGIQAIDGIDEVLVGDARLDAIMAAWIQRELRSTKDSRHTSQLAARNARLHGRATRWLGVLRSRLTGHTLAESGREFGITKERVRQICDRVAQIVREHYRYHAA